MSRIGKKPVAVLEGVNINLNGQEISVKGPKGELSYTVSEYVRMDMGEGDLLLNPVDQSKTARSQWGMSRTLVANMIEGVSTGFSKKLEVNGVGYRAMLQGSDLKLNLGFSHDVILKIPQGLSIEVDKQNNITISGIDKQMVGQFASEIRKFRPPEPFKGKGIKYEGEYIFRKEGKKK